jgi:hypothetical protein
MELFRLTIGFSFCENLTILKKKQEWQNQCQCLYPHHYKKCFHYATLVPYL